MPLDLDIGVWTVDKGFVPLTPPPIPALNTTAQLTAPTLDLSPFYGEPINQTTINNLRTYVRRHIEALPIEGPVNMVGNYSATTGSLSVDVWPAWNVRYTTSAATTSITSNTVLTMTTAGFPFSTNVTSGTMTLFNEQVWTNWNQHWPVPTGAANGAILRQQQILVPDAPASRAPQGFVRHTEAELRRRLEHEQQARAEQERRIAEEVAAKDRAERLLMACLSGRQREDLASKNCFYVDVPLDDGKIERYRIDRGSHGNIKQLDEKGSIIRSFCVQPSGVPVGDSMLAQKLFLESDEASREKLWETTNITEYQDNKKIPYHIPRNQRRQYARQHGLLH